MGLIRIADLLSLISVEVWHVRNGEDLSVNVSSRYVNMISRSLRAGHGAYDESDVSSRMQECDADADAEIDTISVLDTIVSR